MTTIDAPGGYPPPPTPSPASGRTLRRSRTGRVGAGVASGLGEYFGFDPVLFRVLFATSAFFGGAGIIAYLLAWAAIPEEGTGRAPIDGWVGALRRRRVPVWLVALASGLLLWLVAFSWWAPGPFFPVVAVVVLLVVVFGRRDMQAASAEAPVRLTKGGTPGATDGAGDPAWIRDARSWVDEARAASRARRRRALPVRLAVLITLILALTVLGLVDAGSGIQLQTYFWTTLGIVGAGLLTGLVLRRTPWGIAVLLIPAVAGAVAFAGSRASLHDGTGQREWKPTGTPASDYRLAFGQGVLDLRALPAQSQPRTIGVTMGAGQVQIIAPRSLNLTVLANIHIGRLDVDGDEGNGHGGVGLSRTVDPPSGATGAPITVNVHLADGNVTVEHR